MATCPSCTAENPDDQAYCGRCGRAMATPTAVRTPASITDETTVNLRVGSVLHSRYRLDQLLGRGGMGAVWLARDLALDLAVAVKVVNDLLARDPQAMAFLRDEARTAIPLHHPHVVRVNHFEAQGAVTFLVMEYVEGESLAVRLGRERTFPESEARRLGLAIADALAYAHDHRVLHRDVKPANVLLGLDGTIKLADFGIARAVSDSLSRLTGMQTSGTLLYMPPEVIEGETSTPAADWYALGATLYELVSGRPPFHTGDLTHQILNKAPKPLEGVSKEFAALVARLLAKSPGDRPGAAAVREMLGKAPVTDPTPQPVTQPVPARPSTRAERQWRPWHLAAGALLVTLVAVTAVVVNAIRGTHENGSTAEGRDTLPASGPTSQQSPTVPTQTALSTSTPSRGADPGPPLGANAAAAAGGSVGTPSARWVRIPGGTFNMGCSTGDVECGVDEQPRHAVTLSRAYDLMAMEVTLAMYRAYALATKRPVPAQPEWNSNPRQPIVNVTPKDATEFCRWTDGRLPTEAEWERAARGGVPDKKYPWGFDGLVVNGAKFRGASLGPSHGKYTDVVGSYSANPYGLFDMAGNVWEWVADWISPYTATPVTDPQGASSGVRRVLRGGSWEDSSSALRVSYRIGRATDSLDETSGFRCARDVAAGTTPTDRRRR